MGAWSSVLGVAGGPVQNTPSESSREESKGVVYPDANSVEGCCWGVLISWPQGSRSMAWGKER